MSKGRIGKMTTFERGLLDSRVNPVPKVDDLQSVWLRLFTPCLSLLSNPKYSRFQRILAKDFEGMSKRLYFFTFSNLEVSVIQCLSLGLRI